MSERMTVEEARDRAIDALVDWSVAPPGSGRHVHDILDDFQQVIRAEAVKPWREAVRELLRGDFRMPSWLHAQLRALLDGDSEGGE